MNQSKNVRTWAAALLAVAAAACSSPEKSPEKPAAPNSKSAAAAPEAKPESKAVAAAPAAEGPVSGAVSQTVTATATVTAIDLESRRVTMRNEDGKTFSIVCGPEVRNLPQVKVGDIVTCEYRESIAYEVKKPGEATPGATAASAAGRAPEGSMPAAAAGKVVTITATIVAIDREHMRVSLQASDGSVAVVQVRDAEKLARVSVGELVEITCSEALAISVSTPMAK